MFFKRYRFINLFFLLCCFTIHIKAQDSAHIFNKTVDIKLVNQDTLFKIDSISFNKISWFNSSEKATYITLIESDFKNITLPYNNAFVKFEFAFINSPVANKNKFKYKLSGLSSSWRTLEETNELTFTHLPPGNYILEIVYTVGTNSWNIKTLRIPIIVNQIYYKKWWFMAALVFSLVVLLYYIRKHELSHIKKMEELKLKISRNLHDELGSSLTGIAIKSDLLHEKLDISTKKQFLSEISEQSRNAVDALSDIVWAIDSSNNSIQNLSERMESILYQFLRPLNITFTLQSLQNKKPLQINQDHRQHVFLIFKEAITNIMKHSDATHVFVSFTKDKNNLKLIIKDNGTKINNEYRTLNGNGIKNMKLRAEKIHGDIQFSYNKGFTVELSFNYLST